MYMLIEAYIACVISNHIQPPRAHIGMCAPRMHCNAWCTYNIADDTNTLTLLIINIYFGTPSY